MLGQGGAPRRRVQSGLTLVELVVTLAIIGVLAAAAVPMAKVGVKRSRELELRRNLRLLRTAIDNFQKSYVASGGVVHFGQPTNQPGSQPGQASAGAGTSGSTNRGRSRPGASRGARTGAKAAAAQQAPIPLIDVSQFDPVDSKGYPPTLETLVEGVQAFGATPEEKIKFLRRIPRDPMTEDGEWGLRSYQDDFDATSWGRQNVYDVYSQSNATSLEGTKYSEW